MRFFGAALRFGSGAMALAATLALSVPALDADSVDDAVRALSEFAKAGDQPKCLAKLQELKGWKDPRVRDAIADVAKSKDDVIACAAIRIAASGKDAKFLDWLKAEVDDKDLYAEKAGRPDVYSCVLDSIAIYQDASTLRPLQGAVRRFLACDAQFSPRAIRAYGAVRDKTVVGQLIEWLGQVEDRRGGKTSGGASAGAVGKFNTDAQKVRDASRAALYDTLATLTDQDLGECAEWKKWWNEHARSFEFPRPDPSDDADVRKLTEWTDRRYGYRVKRPDGPAWAFKGRDASFRIQLAKVDPQFESGAFVGWSVYSSVGKKIKDIKGYTDWWINDQLPQKEFEKYAKGGEPTTEDRSFGGRDFTVILATGLGKGSLASWGAVEHRIYITKIDCGFLYAWAAVKTTAPVDDKMKMWNFVESVVFTDK